MTNSPFKNAAVLWTGGKDSALALHEARAAGYPVTRLVTFAPENPDFLAHPLEVMKCQAQALELSHEVIRVSEPYDQSYTAAISALHKEQGIEVLVTGDIAEVDHHPNWIRERAKGTGVEVLTPLWDYDREALLQRLITAGFRVVFSCVKSPWFTAAWLGREVSLDTLAELRALNASTGVDLCGENGEYHTVTLGAPLFKKRVQIDYLPASKDGMFYMNIRKVSLH